RTEKDSMYELSAKNDRLNSYVAQGGTNFSGGQKQRLSIARALVKKPELYIFDDSFSALGFKTDAALRKALAPETKDAAVVIIAQRVSSIRHADQIIVINEGEMVGKGTHEELMENCPVYREISDSQTKEA
ncbi:MAG: ATP-binding cassette domain-containing protein, partial [Mediterraneibacter sp.]